MASRDERKPIGTAWVGSCKWGKPEVTEVDVYSRGPLEANVKGVSAGGYRSRIPVAELHETKSAAVAMVRRSLAAKLANAEQDVARLREWLHTWEPES